MSADQEFHCEPAPAPAPPESSVKTMHIDRGGDGLSKTAIIVLGLILALIAGVAFAVLKRAGGAASASAEVATGGAAAETAAPSKGANDAPAECAGDLAGDE